MDPEGQWRSRNLERGELDRLLAELGLAGEDLAGRILAEGVRDELTELRGQLARALDEATTVATEKRRRLEKHGASRPASLGEEPSTIATLEEAIATLENEIAGSARIAFSIRDDWHAGEVRPLTTLSGGETFLVSLALADYRTVRMPIETLLLDEGFGTLDQDTLGVVMQTLEALHSGGMQVGIITYVEALRERIDARVVVEKLGNGRSAVKTKFGG